MSKAPYKQSFGRKIHFFCIFLPKNLVISKKSSTFAPAFEKRSENDL